MKTNLIFKRQVTSNGITQVVTKVVPVDIPFINSGEGWTLSGHTDVIEIMNLSKAEEQPQDTVPFPQESQLDNSAKRTESDKFISNVSGTAKLVRSKGVIKIVARRGKSTYNQTTPNSVCINDFTKNEFFKNCREIHGNNGCFEFSPADGRPYDYWNDIIDKEYTRQKRQITSTTP